MNTLEIYLTIVPPEILISATFIGLIVIAAIPARLRLVVALAAVPPWLLLSRLLDLGAIAAGSKATGWLIMGLVAIAAVIDHRPKRQLPPVVWFYPVIAGTTMLWAINAEEPLLHLVGQFQWLVLSIAAILVARTITTEADLRRVVYALLFGTGIGVLIIFSAIVRNPGEIFRAGVGRFEPYGVNSNQIASIFIFGVPLLIYYATKSKSSLLKLPALGLAALGGLMSILTASRSTVFPTALLLVLVCWEFRKKPIFIAAAAVAIVIGLYLGSGLLEQASTERLASLDSGRYEVFGIYLQEIAKEPVFGRLFNRPEVAPADKHSHNAYIEMMYEYGAIITLPLIIMAAVTLKSMLTVWRQRLLNARDPEFITVTLGVLAMTYLHGMVTLAIYHSTYSWAFVHILLSVFAISVARQPLTITDPAPARSAPQPAAPHPQSPPRSDHYGPANPRDNNWAALPY